MNIVRWLLWLMLAFAAMPALAQSYMTTVTAQVKDINGTIYNSCRYSATLVNLSTSTLTLGGTALPDQFKQVTGTQCTGNGNLSTKLVANTALIPNNSQWRFTICDSNGANCFNVQTTISGTTMDITALVQSAATILPVSNAALLAFFPLRASFTNAGGVLTPATSCGIAPRSGTINTITLATNGLAGNATIDLSTETFAQFLAGTAATSMTNGNTISITGARGIQVTTFTGWVTTTITGGNVYCFTLSNPATIQQLAVLVNY